MFFDLQALVSLVSLVFFSFSSKPKKTIENQRNQINPRLQIEKHQKHMEKQKKQKKQSLSKLLAHTPFCIYDAKKLVVWSFGCVNVFPYFFLFCFFECVFRGFGLYGGLRG
jgi:L-lactate permease